MADEMMQRYELAKFINENAYNIPGNTMNESVQTNVSDVVLSKMFELTIGKYNKIDFTSIEKSRGDVTKTKFYQNLNECINTLIDIHTVTNKIPSIIIVSDALNNLRTMTNIFEYNFRIKNNCAIMIYNTIYYAIMEATSYIIATSIDISKDTGAVTVHELDSKAMCLITSLSAFNKSVADNSLMKFMKSTNEINTQNESAADLIVDGAANIIGKFLGTAKNRKKAAKAAVITTVVISTLWLGAHIIPILREIIYWIYKARQKIADAAELQAKFLELNIESMEHIDKDVVIGRGKKITTEKLITRQTKYANIFHSIANKFALDSDKASRDSSLEIKQSKIDVSDVII